MRYTKVPANTFQQIQLNAGILLRDFDVTDGSFDAEDMVGATSGGVSFNGAAEYVDFGEDIDNIPPNTKELKRVNSYTAEMSGTFVTVSSTATKMLVGAADVDVSGKVTPRMDLESEDFEDLWWVGDYSDKNGNATGGFIAIHLMNALSTGGFQIQSANRGKGTFSFTFTGHYSINEQDTVPFEIYMRGGEDDENETSLSTLAISSTTLTPEFDEDVLSYTASTSSTSNTVTATATDQDATIVITVNGNSIASGGTATWVNGQNDVLVSVKNGGATRNYRVKVTKS